jgi:RNA polymerase sigma factor (sigma-70 family)
LLTEQFHQHGRLFFKLAHGIVRDVNLAEDACQQAMTKAWECRERITDRPRLRAWLARTVVNEALQMVRRKGTERRVLEGMGVNGEVWPEEERLALREAIVQGLTTVPEPARTIVTLRLVRQMSGNEVGELLACSAVEVSRQLHAGLEQLRKALEWSQVEVGR